MTRFHVPAAFIALSLCWPSTAAADFVASTGQIDLSDAAVGLGFETPHPELTVWDRGILTVDPASLLVSDAIEGAQSIEVGGAMSHAAIDLRDVLAPLADRRISLRLWVQPRGVDLKGAVEWRAGDSPLARSHQRVPLVYTGRATSDGWREMSTGPFDARLLGAVPDRLMLVDGTRGFSADALFPSTFVVGNDFRARVDAIGVYELGPRSVPDAPCTTLDESPCGLDGVCFAGRCVDGVVANGRPPLDPGQLAATLERRGFAMQLAHAERARTDALAVYAATLRSLANGPPHGVYPGIHRAIAAADLSHAFGPQAGMGFTFAPFCTVWGSANLLPGAPELPLIASQPEGTSPDERLPIGGAITAIDGLDPLVWLDAHQHLPTYAEDPTIRTFLLFAMLGRTGGEITVASCPRADGLPCADDEVVIEVLDLGPGRLAELRGDVPATPLYCDLRVTRAADLPGSAVTADVQWASMGEVRMISHDGFSPVNSSESHAAFLAAVSGDPRGIVLDQRLGPGGRAEEVTWLLTRFLGAEVGNVWLDVPRADDDVVTDLLAACPGSFEDPVWCALVHTIRFRSATEGDGEAADVPLVVLTGFDASGNDFFLDGIVARTAPTLRLGHGTSEGMFGILASGPAIGGDDAPGTLQVTDAIRFDPDAPPPQPPYDYISGPGLAPDERCVQLQSDLVVGVDTCLARAVGWIDALPP